MGFENIIGGLATGLSQGALEGYKLGSTLQQRDIENKRLQDMADLAKNKDIRDAAEEARKVETFGFAKNKLQRKEDYERALKGHIDSGKTEIAELTKTFDPDRSKWKPEDISKIDAIKERMHDNIYNTMYGNDPVKAEQFQLMREAKFPKTPLEGYSRALQMYENERDPAKKKDLWTKAERWKGAVENYLDKSNYYKGLYGRGHGSGSGGTGKEHYITRDMPVKKADGSGYEIDPNTGKPVTEKRFYQYNDKQGNFRDITDTLFPDDKRERRTMAIRDLSSGKYSDADYAAKVKGLNAAGLIDDTIANSLMNTRKQQKQVIGGSGYSPEDFVGLDSL